MSWPHTQTHSWRDNEKHLFCFADVGLLRTRTNHIMFSNFMCEWVNEWGKETPDSSLLIRLCRNHLKNAEKLRATLTLLWNLEITDNRPRTESAKDRALNWIQTLRSYKVTGDRKPVLSENSSLIRCLLIRSCLVRRLCCIKWLIKKENCLLIEGNWDRRWRP